MQPRPWPCPVGAAWVWVWVWVWDVPRGGQTAVDRGRGEGGDLARTWFECGGAVAQGRRAGADVDADAMQQTDRRAVQLRAFEVWCFAV
jgi:hypothetical protein